ncbi:hypothetical protein HYS03_00055 [Candidatus Woesebacteria bacterium]|nr:hypothetical protein [Candidatus Woesebacteria bacterium]QQG47588.1 MAG: hypothetical protein HY044_00660 [Candidatus Woesebacteria bacterium]
MKNKRLISAIKLTFIFLILLAIVFTLKLIQQKQNLQSSAAGINDLRSYYPNYQMYQKYYLEGFNYVNGNKQRAVIWFEPQDKWSFRLYNYAPEDPNSRCHYDQLSWWDDGFLRYVKTHNECPGTTSNEIVYDPPIIFLPRYWSEKKPWSLNNQSNATYYENGQQVCTGVNNYTGSVIGWEEIAPGVKAIHWRTTQTTNWKTGNIQGRCYAGYTTNWQEDYWLIPSMPKQGGESANALKRTKGGNLDVQADSWDIWFDYWKPLPK